ncbi:MAG TPA: Crp/Fnr family transcriptional regulator [Chloroflexota bacterium]|nr:Crp/Fnr family transcriptional regulator [Chloroflexota bacterium]
MSQPSHVPPSAHRPLPALIDLLPPEEIAHLQEVWKRVPLQEAQTLIWPNEPITHVYFPISGIVSILSHGHDGEIVETGLVGREGLVGLPIFLGADTGPHQAQVQVPGQAWRMPTDAFRALAGEDGPLRTLRRLLLRYTQARMVMTTQGVLCNRLHALDERCARWLLLVHDRVDGDTFFITHEFIAIMLGVRRAGVTVAMGALRRAGVLQYERGEVTILDRDGLEAASCPCYRTIRRHFDQASGNPQPSSPSESDSTARRLLG